MSTARVALCQMKVTASKADNLIKAASMIASARKDHKADIVVLPECFSCPFGTQYFSKYAEALPAIGSKPEDILPHAESKFPAAACLSKAALENQVWIVGGSVPELVPAAHSSSSSSEPKEESKDKIYNSSMVFCPEGVLRAVHRKIHLFCIRSETVTLDEADVLTAGRTPTVVNVAARPASAMPSFKMGIGICFDIRFSQLANFYHEADTSFLVYPSAFSMVTGPPHWILATRSRAVDTQQYVAMCSIARDTTSDYVAFGHSVLVDPWGEVVCEAQEGEEIVSADIDMKRVAEVRVKLPITNGRRTDLYGLQQWNA